jgi:hypothetical protein
MNVLKISAVIPSAGLSPITQVRHANNTKILKKPKSADFVRLNSHRLLYQWNLLSRRFADLKNARN